jgi:hypothetical protein
VKIVIYRKGASPIEMEGADRVRVMCGKDHFELREQGGLLVRLEEHDGTLTIDLALFPAGANAVRLKSGLR